MKIITIALGLLVSTMSFAKEYKLSCEARHNYDLVVQTEVTLGEKERNKSFGVFNEFEFFLSSNGNDIIELQTLNNYDPSRSYATAKMTEAGSIVELSIWRRDFLLEVRCTL